MAQPREPRRELERLLSVFHHEAGTPVALIASALRRLQRGGTLGDQDADLVEAAVRQTEVLERLLDQLRVANEGRLQLEPTPIDLVALAEELVEDLRATVLEEHPCEVRAPGGPAPVEADAARIRQVLSNLLSNAAQYSGPGTVIEVEVRPEAREAVLAVTDQGAGIAPADLERIFERYERATEEGPGLGLGLYVVWRIVTAHGGRVEAVPAPAGPGARFVVILPRSARAGAEGAGVE